MLIRSSNETTPGAAADVRLMAATGSRRRKQYGQSVSAGDIVLSGAFIRPVEAQSGAK